MNKERKGQVAHTYLRYLASRGHCFGSTENSSESQAFFALRGVEHRKVYVVLGLGLTGSTLIEAYAKTALAILEFEFLYGHRPAFLDNGLRREWGNVPGVKFDEIATVMRPILKRTVERICRPQRRLRRQK